MKKEVRVINLRIWEESEHCFVLSLLDHKTKQTLMLYFNFIGGLRRKGGYGVLNYFLEDSWVDEVSL